MQKQQLDEEIGNIDVKLMEVRSKMRDIPKARAKLASLEFDSSSAKINYCLCHLSKKLDPKLHLPHKSNLPCSDVGSRWDGAVRSLLRAVAHPFGWFPPLSDSHLHIRVFVVFRCCSPLWVVVFVMGSLSVCHGGGGVGSSPLGGSLSVCVLRSVADSCLICGDGSGGVAVL
jgi:hypothetical protein